jgi:hypothetical protein
MVGNFTAHVRFLCADCLSGGQTDQNGQGGGGFHNFCGFHTTLHEARKSDFSQDDDSRAEQPAMQMSAGTLRIVETQN